MVFFLLKTQELMAVLSAMTVLTAASKAEGGMEFGVTSEIISAEGNTPGVDECFSAPRCDPNYKYRTLNGTCNNIEHPLWGMGGASFLRFFPAQYKDGVSAIKDASNGKPLPSPRSISSKLFPDKFVPDKTQAFFMAYWGQVVAHSASLILFDPESCCVDKKVPEKPLTPYCLPIPVSKDDPFYSKYNVTCLSYSRTYTMERMMPDCNTSPKQPFNYASQYQDLSMVYGFNDEAAEEVRTRKGGRLLTSQFHGEETMPITHEPGLFCRIKPNGVCLKGGDERSNQNVGLSAVWVMLVKEHNRLADGLSRVNPSWDDETLYQEARRINVAQTQHITYSEYLPLILHPKYIDGLRLAPSNSYSDYSPKMQPGTITSASVAFLRLQHSAIRGVTDKVKTSRGGCPFSTLALEDYWWVSANATLLCYDEVLDRLTTEQARAKSRFYSRQLTELYQREGKEYGDDLTAVDIMRGRDSGLPPYNQFRKLCGLKQFRSFEAMVPQVRPEVVSILKKVYASVDDIDAYVGAVVENPVGPEFSGPTSQCVFGQQFARWKFADRFYYEHRDQVSSFKPDQLAALRKVTLSSLLCKNTNLKTVHRRSLQVPSPKNPQIKCKDAYSLDLNLWKES